jgi:hypothetical protein
VRQPDQDARDERPEDLADVADREAQGVGRRDQLGGHDAGNDGTARRGGSGEAGRLDGDQGQDQAHGLQVQQRLGQQDERDRPGHEGRHQVEAAAVDDVRDGAAVEAEDHDGDEPGQSGQAYVQR